MISSLRTLSRSLAFCFVLSRMSLAQSSSPAEGIPVTDPLIVAKCGSCHIRDERGNMERISWARATPEAWQDVLRRMILGHGVSVAPAEARSMIKYLSTDHGLAPEEAKAVLYDAERRVREETNLPPARMELQSGLIRTDVPAPRETAAAPKTALPALD